MIEHRQVDLRSDGHADRESSAAADQRDPRGVDLERGGAGVALG